MKSLRLSLTGQKLGFIELKTFGRVTGDSISVANVFEGNIASVGLYPSVHDGQQTDLTEAVILLVQ